MSSEPETISLSKLLDASDNRERVAEALRRDPSICQAYAKLPAQTQPPILIYGNRLADGSHRVAAALRRGDATARAVRWHREGQWDAEPDGAEWEKQVEQEFQSLLA